MSEDTKLTGNISGRKLFILGTASIVGPWLILTAQWIGYTGISVILAFIICGMLCLPIGLCYGELAGLFRSKGGSYEYVRAAFGKDAGYWISWFTMFTYISLIVFQIISVVTLITYSGGFEFNAVTLAGLCILMMLLMTLLNSRNINIAGSLQMVLFAFLAVAGFFFATVFITSDVWSFEWMGEFFAQGMMNFNQTLGMDTGFLIAIAALVTMFFGFELIPQFSGESSYPVNRYWKLMLGGIVFVIIFDAFICFAECGMKPIDSYGQFTNSYDFIVALYEVDGGFVSSILSRAYFGDWLSWIIIIANFCCMACCLIGFWLGGSRILHSMGTAGSLPRFFGKVNGQGVPSWGNYFVLIMVFVLTMIALSGDKWINATFSLMALGCGFTYLGVSLAFLKLKKTRPDIERPWSAPCGYAVGVIAVCSSAFMAVMMIYAIVSSALSGDYTMAMMTAVFFSVVAVLFFMMKKDQREHPDRYIEDDLLPPKSA